jgi:hypothetical protein
LHNKQLERMKAHSHVPNKKNKSQKSEGLYIDFLIVQNSALENMCKAYCSVSLFLPDLLLTIVIYGVECAGITTEADER